MAQLVAYYEEKPVKKGQGVVIQQPLEEASGSILNADRVEPGVVYVVAPHVSSRLLVPFGQYDSWSLTERFNETLRVMNVLGAKSIECKTYGRASRTRRFAIALPIGKGTDRRTQLEQSGFDYAHQGQGALPMDPRPLRWPDIPGLEAAVEGVLKNQSTRTTISIDSSTDYKRDSKLAGRLRGAGFSLGATSETNNVTVLKVEALFPGPDELKRIRKHG